MSQHRNSSIAGNQARSNNEEFFDLHPRPWDVECYNLDKYVRIFVDHNNIDTFLLEITYPTWIEANYKLKMMEQIFKDDITCVYRNGKKLFLRKLLF